MRDPQLERQLEQNLTILSVMALLIAVVSVFAWTLNFPTHFEDVSNLLPKIASETLSEYSKAESFSQKMELLPELLGHNIARPGLGLSYVFGSTIATDNPAAHRFMNLAWHLAGVMLVFVLVLGALRDWRGELDDKRPRRDLLAAGLVAAAFGVHPLQVESVVYISGRDGLLCGPPTLAAFAVFLAVLRRAGAGRGLRLGTYLAGLALYVFALLCGEGALALPVFVLAYDWALLERREESPGTKERVAFHAPLWAVAAGFVALYRIGAEATGDPAIGGDFSWLASYPPAWLGYLRLLVLPVGLSVDHGFATPASTLAPLTLPALGAHALLVAGIIVAARRGARVVAALGLALYGALLPWAGIVPYADPVAEHRAWLAVLPAVGVPAMAARWLWNRAVGAQRPALWVAAGLSAVLLLGALSAARARVWSSSQTLWADAVRKNPGLARPHYQLGTAYLLDDRKQEAMDEFGAALRADPDFAPAALNRGGLFLEAGDLENARRNFERAVSANPSHAPARYNLAEALFRMGRLEPALAEVRVAIKLNPGNGTFLMKEGEILEALGRHEDALAAWGVALEKGVSDRRALMERAALLAFEHGYNNTAAGYLRELTALYPVDPNTWYNLARLQEQIGEPGEAILNYQRAIMANPTMASAHFNIGRLYELEGKCTKAGAHYRMAGSYAPKYLAEYENFERAQKEGTRCPLDEAPIPVPQPAR